jgi:AraC-like DNA-binding protein
MAYREYQPHPALRPFVDRFWTRTLGKAPGELRVLPDGCMDVMVNLDRGTAYAVGAMTRPLVIPARSGPGGRLVAVRFRPGAAGPFLRVAAHQLTDQRVAAEGLGLGWLAALRERIGTGTLSAREAVGPLEGALLGQLSAVAAPDPLVAQAVEAFFSREGTGRLAVERLARRLGVSRQHLARRFREEVGIGPKELARVARVQWAVATLQSGPRAGLAAAAVDIGYFDEAHMDRDFRQLVGVTPGQLRAAPGSIRPVFSLLG